MCRGGHCDPGLELEITSRDVILSAFILITKRDMIAVAKTVVATIFPRGWYCHALRDLAYIDCFAQKKGVSN